MTKYNSSFNDTYPFSDTTGQFALAANTELTYTVPGEAKNIYRAQFSWNFDSNVWVRINGTAVVPTPGTMTSDSQCERCPERKYVKGGDVIHFISNATVTDAGFSLLQLP